MLLDVSMSVSLEELLDNQRPTFSDIPSAARLLVLSGPEHVREWVANAHQRQDPAAQWIFESDVSVAYMTPADAIPLALLARQEARRQCLASLSNCSAASQQLDAALTAAEATAHRLRQALAHNYRTGDA